MRSRKIEIKLSDFYKPTPKQQEAHASDKLITLFGGAVGGGKSVWLCLESLILSLEYPGNRGFLGRKVGKHFNETTLKTWQDKIPSSLYRINWQKSTITIYTGGSKNSEIIFGGMNTQEEKDRFTSAEYGFYAIDQSEELDEDDYLAGMGRLRKKLPDGSTPRYRGLFSANPKQCYLRKIVKTPDKDQIFIKSLHTDNPYLPPDYIPRLRELYKFRPEMLKALIEGSWDFLEGTNIIIRYDDANACAGRILPARPYEKRIVVVDPARFGDDENVIYGWHNETIIKQDIYGDAKRTTETAARAVKMCREIKGNEIAIETDGVGGGVADVARDILGEDSGIEVRELVASSKADRPDKFANQRAEAWWEASEWFADKQCSIPADDGLINELTSVQYEFRLGKIIVESIDKIKDRIGKSPDRATGVIWGLYSVKRARDIYETEKKETPTRKWVKERSLERTGVGRSYGEMEE